MNEPTPTSSPAQAHSDLDQLPGAGIASRPMQIIVAADCSGSMSGAKIASLNSALVEAFDALRGAAHENPTAHMMVRAIAFDSSARWHIADPTSVDNLSWPQLVAGGSTDMAGAVRLLVDALDMAKMPERGLPPVLILVSDGMPHDIRAFRAEVDTLLKSAWGKKAVRVAIGIGDDAEESTLETFIANPEIPVLVARNSADLTRYIRWATVGVSRVVSAPRSGSDHGQGVVVLPPPPPPTPAGPGDVW
jgi:uncharacterized protein YegL